jgi:hypothetical protein
MSRRGPRRQARTDLDLVRHWLEEAEAGGYEVDQVEGYVAGMATYVLAGELALAELLAGELPRPGFPEALRQAAPARWRRSAGFSLAIADTAAARHDVVSCAGLLAKAAIEAAQAALAERGEWALNEKAIVRRAALGARVEAIMAAPGDRPFELSRAVTAMRAALGIPRSAPATTGLTARWARAPRRGRSRSVGDGARQRAAKAEGIEVETLAREGDPAATLIELAEEQEVDLIHHLPRSRSGRSRQGRRSLVLHPATPGATQPTGRPRPAGAVLQGYFFALALRPAEDRRVVPRLELARAVVVRLPRAACCTSSRSLAIRLLVRRRFLRASRSVLSTSLSSSREPRDISERRSFSAACAASIESFSRPSASGPPLAAPR